MNRPHNRANRDHLAAALKVPYGRNYLNGLLTQSFTGLSAPIAPKRVGAGAGVRHAERPAYDDAREILDVCAAFVDWRR
eukprot:10143355-Lingulodinium_polyedra.AAC.1